MSKGIIRILSTFFYIGYLPFVPGTFGSLAGICIFILTQADKTAYLFLTLLITGIGFIVCPRQEKMVGRKDPPCIVIDEVSGMLISLLFLPYDIKIAALAFILFRALDTLKPFPAGRLERLGWGAGVMADDLVAGFYANIILQAALRATSFKVS